MKKITKTINLKKMLGIAALCFGLSNFGIAQCNSSFTYTTTSTGVMATSTSTGTTSTSQYYWTLLNFNQYGANDTVSFSPLYNGTYTLSLQTDSSAGCSSSTSQTITISGGQNPPACNGNFTYTIDTSGLATFTSLMVDPYNSVNYSWGFGDGTYAYTANPVHQYNYNGTYTVGLTVSNMYGCNSTTYQTITVHNGDTCNLHVSYTYTLASNGQVYFMNTSTGVDSNATINWSFGNSNSSYNQNYVTNTYAYNGTYLATLHIGDSTSVCYGSLTDTIVITNTATAPVCQAMFNDSLFSNGNTLFVNISSGTTANTNYLWHFGFGSTMSTAINPSFTYTANGVYAVTLFISDSSTGCSSSYTDSVHITNANPACIASVSFVLHKDSLNPQPGVWEISPVYSSQVYAAYWYWGDGTYTTGLYPSHTYTAAGQYSVCVSVVAPCGDSSYICQSDSLYRLASNNSTNGANSMIQVTVVNSTTGIKTNTQESAQISLYPNPSAGVFTLNLMNVSATKAQVNITNLLGETVYSSQEQVSNNTLTKAIDLQSTANGTYFMKVIVGEKSYTQKIIINK